MEKGYCPNEIHVVRFLNGNISETIAKLCLLLAVLTVSAETGEHWAKPSLHRRDPPAKRCSYQPVTMLQPQPFIPVDAPLKPAPVEAKAEAAPVKIDEMITLVSVTW